MWTNPIINTIKRLERKWRRKYYEYKVKKQVSSMGTGIYVGGNTILTDNTKLGDNTHFNGMTVWGLGQVEIGDNFRSGPGCDIRTMTHKYNGETLPYDTTWVVEDVVVEDNVWFGEDVTVLPGNVIKEGAIIQAESVVVNDIPKCAIAGGHPAKVFKYREEEQYERLKNEGRFINSWNDISYEYQ
jgi:acetyltransferase-like isoleucine patch superfamily enzyme